MTIRAATGITSATMDVHSRSLHARFAIKSKKNSMRWLYRFGVCLGLDLVIAVFVLCVLFMALEPRADAGVSAANGEGVAFGSDGDIAVARGQKNEVKIEQPKKGVHISGKIHIKLKVGQNIKRVFVFIDDKYFASGPPYNLVWNSATVSNGPHRITVAAATTALSPNALFQASQSQTAQFVVHNPLGWPAGVPTPNAIPTLTPPVNPITVGPGTNGVVGNATQNMTTGVVSGTDDTAAFQTLLNSHDIIVQAGNYNIVTNIQPPSDRVIQCQPGAVFYCSTTDGSHGPCFNLGYYGSTVTRVSISGCTFAGTNVPVGSNNYGANYNEGTVLMAIAGDGEYPGASYINLQNNTFVDGQQDGIEIYDNCGAANSTSGWCGGVKPGLEGPHHIYVQGNTFRHGNTGPGVHINGGHQIYIYNNTFTDWNLNQEENPGTLEVIWGLYMYKNTLLTSSIGQPGQEMLTCVGNQTIASNGSGCWAVQNTINGGCGSNGTCLTIAVGTPGLNGISTGNYYGNVVENGASILGGGSNQLTMPYCNGGTCNTTGWLQVPPTP